MNTQLCPAQKKSYFKVLSILKHNQILVISTPTGLGKTTILKALTKKIGGALLTVHDFLKIQREHHPLALEENVEYWLMEALKTSDTILVDDIHLLEELMGNGSRFYPRKGMLDIVLNAICSYATEFNKKLIFAHTGKAIKSIDTKALYVSLKNLEIEDYEFLGSQFLKESNYSESIFEEIYRFAPGLNIYQLQSVCQNLNFKKDLNSNDFINFLLEHHFTTDFSIDNKDMLDFKDLKGMDDIIDALKTHIILPFTNNSIVNKLKLKPKKGVLLYGLPGTGKTSLGRALASKMKGKFFLIDGSFVSNSPDFYQKVKEVFEAAKQKAPSIIFIDDSDVIWEKSYETGLYRYLLTELDGLQEEQHRVCVIMAAMEIIKIPPALLRSGRLELWLELPLPGEKARIEILRHWIKKEPEHFEQVDLKILGRHTEGFSGADLKKITEDAKNLYAYDHINNEKTLPMHDYFLKAAKTIREYKNKQLDAEKKLEAQFKNTPYPFLFSPFSLNVDSKKEDYELC